MISDLLYANRTPLGDENAAIGKYMYIRLRNHRME